MAAAEKKDGSGSGLPIAIMATVLRALLLPISSAGGLTLFRYLGWGG